MGMYFFVNCNVIFMFHMWAIMQWLGVCLGGYFVRRGVNMVGEEIYNVETIGNNIFVIGKWLSILDCKKNDIELNTNDIGIAHACV